MAYVETISLTDIMHERVYTLVEEIDYRNADVNSVMESEPEEIIWLYTKTNRQKIWHRYMKEMKEWQGFPMHQQLLRQ